MLQAFDCFVSWCCQVTSERVGVVVGDRFSCCFFLDGPVGEDLFVDDRGLHLAGTVTAPVVVGVDERCYFSAGLGFGGKMPA